MARLKLTKLVYNTESINRETYSPVVSLTVDSCTNDDLILDSEEDFVLKVGKRTNNNYLAYNIFKLGYSVRAYRTYQVQNYLSLQLDKQGRETYFDVTSEDESVLDSEFFNNFTTESTYAIKLQFAEDLKYGDYLLLNDHKYIYCLWYGEVGNRIPLDTSKFDKDFRIDNTKESLLNALINIGAKVYEDEDDICYSFPILYKPEPRYYIEGETVKPEDCSFDIFYRGNMDRLVQITNAEKVVRFRTILPREIEDIKVLITNIHSNIYSIQITVENDFGNYKEFYSGSFSEIESQINNKSKIIKMTLYESTIPLGEYSLKLNNDNIIRITTPMSEPYEDTLFEIKNDYAVINRDCIIFSETEVSCAKYNFLTKGKIDSMPLCLYYLYLFTTGTFTGLINSYNILVEDIDNINYNTIYFDNVNHYLDTSKLVTKNGELTKFHRVFIEELIIKTIANFIDGTDSKSYDEIITYIMEFFPMFKKIEIYKTSEDLDNETAEFNIDLTYNIYEENQTVNFTLEITKLLSEG